MAYTYQVTAIGYLIPTYALAITPTDMIIDNTTGLISWTPNTPGTENVKVLAINSQGVDTQTFTITVYQKPKITSMPVTSTIIGEPYTYTVKAIGNPVPTYALTITPTGMIIDNTTGLISWTPNTPGTENVEVLAINSQGVDTQTFSITAFEKPKITSTPVPTATVGVPYTYIVKAAGSPVLAFALTITPTGMTIDNTTGVISWTPNTPGTADVEVLVTNAKPKFRTLKNE